MTSSTVHPDRVYEIVSERKLADDRLPTPEELQEALSTLGAADEFLIDPILLGVIRTANRAADEAGGVTFEDVARLIGWADDIALRAEEIVETAEKVMVVARSALIQSAGGYLTEGSPFKDNGVTKDQSEWNRQRREYGFGRRTSGGDDA